MLSSTKASGAFRPFRRASAADPSSVSIHESIAPSTRSSKWGWVRKSGRREAPTQTDLLVEQIQQAIEKQRSRLGRSEPRAVRDQRQSEFLEVVAALLDEYLERFTTATLHQLSSSKVSSDTLDPGHDVLGIPALAASSRIQFYESLGSPSRHELHKHPGGILAPAILDGLAAIQFAPMGTPDSPCGSKGLGLVCEIVEVGFVQHKISTWTLPCAMSNPPKRPLDEREWVALGSCKGMVSVLVQFFDGLAKGRPQPTAPYTKAFSLFLSPATMAAAPLYRPDFSFSYRHQFDFEAFANDRSSRLENESRECQQAYARIKALYERHFSSRQAAPRQEQPKKQDSKFDDALDMSVGISPDTPACPPCNTVTGSSTAASSDQSHGSRGHLAQSLISRVKVSALASFFDSLSFTNEHQKFSRSKEARTNSVDVLPDKNVSAGSLPATSPVLSPLGQVHRDSSSSLTHSGPSAFRSAAFGSPPILGSASTRTSDSTLSPSHPAPQALATQPITFGQLPLLPHSPPVPQQQHQSPLDLYPATPATPFAQLLTQSQPLPFGSLGCLAPTASNSAGSAQAYSLSLAVASGSAPPRLGLHATSSPTVSLPPLASLASPASTTLFSGLTGPSGSGLVFPPPPAASRFVTAALPGATAPGLLGTLAPPPPPLPSPSSFVIEGKPMSSPFAALVAASHEGAAINPAPSFSFTPTIPQPSAPSMNACASPFAKLVVEANPTNPANSAKGIDTSSFFVDACHGMKTSPIAKTETTAGKPESLAKTAFVSQHEDPKPEREVMASQPMTKQRGSLVSVHQSESASSSLSERFGGSKLAFEQAATPKRAGVQRELSGLENARHVSRLLEKFSG
ncbi:uncharacterized protein BJ171DRAFT_490389 [Polychytrium aggregatum]|uniref:uncharacterized protein n=1 Tax=Polychytrium aggregatum TaxID=110093 RepID=UPI0022FE6123|nr:uncharacterized protein BJ171DRAFT_490389 [Polychytrium aggregatum]KAI9208156.1 hypothetical protein BJ171DRAFT_490389 [Polychytrium aggregatum]